MIVPDPTPSARFEEPIRIDSELSFTRGFIRFDDITVDKAGNVQLILGLAERDYGVPCRITFTRQIHWPADAMARALSLREFIVECLGHEVDELIRSRGERVFDPHPPGSSG